MPAPETLTGLAPAKVNLVLEVLGTRPDGYHELDTILQTLALADRVTISRGDGPPVLVLGLMANGTPADGSNLAWRAAEALAAVCGESTAGLTIAIDKEIPAAGGLGGGASDAATVLRLLQQWWPAASEDALQRAAAEVGSDESFFLDGGTARARGRGEVVTPLPALPPHAVVLFIPPGTIEAKTPRLFAALAGQPFDSGSVAAAFVKEPPRRFASADVYNAFERVAFDVFPGLASLHERLESGVGEPIRLAGAGPTLFWIGTEARAGAVAAASAGLPCTTIRSATAGSLWRR
ncbi:MAG: 4-(cytidine 5'-diphospho)-2-C-methyl-D-erythritol kinase [Chloroflexi bacterium]|nr:4-(cytidine 5'-diphospho)-2-C-methyl-D-erythritol kinase [Chloroflexota bacterium]